MNSGSFTDFRDALRAFESGVDWDRYQAGIITEWQIRGWVGDATWEAWEAGEISWTDMQYRSMNSLGFVGYQFGEALLIDLGYYQDDVYYGNGAASNTWDGTWTGKNGATSLEAFMTAAVQEPAILDAFGYNLSVIETGLAQQGKSLDDFLGTNGSYTSGGQTVTVELTLTGILAAAHLRGAWGTLSLLLSGAVSTDENGTSILQYVAQFGGYDSPTVTTLIADWEAGQGGTGGIGGGDDYLLSWGWGTHQTIEGFDPAHDRIDLQTLFGADDIALREVSGSTVIAVLFGLDGEQQTLTLQGVGLAELDSGNFLHAGGALITIEAALDTADSGLTLVGSTGSDSLSGSTLADLLYGSAGGDELRGLAGDDRLFGGSGSDRLFAAGGKDSLFGGDGRDHLIGGRGSDLLEGNSGADVLNGGSGNDTLVGGPGDDTFVVDESGDKVQEIAGEGHDLLRSNAASYSLPTGSDGHVEDARLTAAAGDATLFGNSLANRISGNAADNRLVGGLADDVLVGADGDDRLTGGAGNDRLVGGSGQDTLVIGIEDRAFGGSGSDAFRFNASALANAESGGPLIKDFEGRDFGGGQDSFVFGPGLERGLFAYRDGAGFTGQGNSEARLAGDDRVALDFDGDGQRDLAFRVSGLTAPNQLTASDFVWL